MFSIPLAQIHASNTSESPLKEILPLDNCLPLDNTNLKAGKQQF